MADLPRMKELSRYLKQIRKRLGISQQEFAKVLGVPYDLVWRIENDRLKKGPAYETLLPILKWYLEEKRGHQKGLRKELSRASIESVIAHYCELNLRGPGNSKLRESFKKTVVLLYSQLQSLEREEQEEES